MTDAEHQLIDGLADEFLERLQRGESPSISQYELRTPNTPRKSAVFCLPSS